jgi:hypothetical protein
MPTELEHMLRQENDTIKQENRMLMGRNDSLSSEIERISRQRPGPELEMEIRKLRSELQDKSVNNEKLSIQVGELMHDSEKQGSRQK